MDEFMGKRVLIIGGASGIGLAAAKKYLDYGAKVAVMDFNEKKVNELSRMESKDRCIARVGDARDKTAVETVVNDMTVQWNGIDILVYSAGIFPDRLLLDMKEEEWDSVMDINAKGAFLTCQAAARQMIAQGQGGSIVTIASGSYQVARVGSGHYCASKGALVMLTKVLALELAPYQIQVNSIAPGLIDHPVFSEEYKESFRAQIPLGRIGQAEDAASAVLMITSHYNTFITGQVIMVDGGATAGRYGLPLSNKT